MKKHITFLFVLLLMLGSHLTASARQMYVVSVGICNYLYQNPLSKTENDARDIAALYHTHTDNVVLLTGKDATHDNVLYALHTVATMCQPDDVFVFFFSGHGAKNGLCMQDSKSSHTMLTFTEIQEVLRQCKASNKQLLIDACYSGKMRSRSSSSTNRARTTLTDKQGVMLFMSSRDGEVSRENNAGNNGFFTQYLLQALKGGADTDGDRIVTAKEAFLFVSKKVSASTGGEQNPVMWGKFNDSMRLMNWNPARR